jgi:hypothetical protein
MARYCLNNERKQKRALNFICMEMGQILYSAIEDLMKEVSSYFEANFIFGYRGFNDGS